MGPIDRVERGRVIGAEVAAAVVFFADVAKVVTEFVTQDDRAARLGAGSNGELTAKTAVVRIVSNDHRIVAAWCSCARSARRRLTRWEDGTQRVAFAVEAVGRVARAAATDAAFL